MTTAQEFLKEFDRESATTRKFLSRIPEDKYDYKPHPKSMPMRNLAVHLAELPGWITMTMDTDGLDFATMDYKPTPIKNNKELMDIFEKSVAKGRKTLETADESKFTKPWVMRNGEQIYSSDSKAEVIRHALNQTTHHRAQLGVYLRLLDVPIPGSYGPSADEPMF